MLYTVMPIEDVLGEPAWQMDPYAAWRASMGPVEPPMLVSCRVSGVPLSVWPMPDGRGQVERVMSTDPADYLDPTISPGSMVDIREYL
ncbi:MAG: YlzJ-like family protein [Bacillota bacterium]